MDVTYAIVKVYVTEGNDTEPGKGHYLSDILQKRNQTIKTERKLKQKLDISFPIFSKTEIKIIKIDEK